MNGTKYVNNQNVVGDRKVLKVMSFNIQNGQGMDGKVDIREPVKLYVINKAWMYYVCRKLNGNLFPKTNIEPKILGTKQKILEMNVECQIITFQVREQY